MREHIRHRKFELHNHEWLQAITQDSDNIQMGYGIAYVDSQDGPVFIDSHTSNYATILWKKEKRKKDL